MLLNAFFNIIFNAFFNLSPLSSSLLLLSPPLPARAAAALPPPALLLQPLTARPVREQVRYQLQYQLLPDEEDGIAAHGDESAALWMSMNVPQVRDTPTAL